MIRQEAREAAAGYFRATADHEMAGFVESGKYDAWTVVQHFNAAELREREACAKVADKYRPGIEGTGLWTEASDKIAAAIRARTILADKEPNHGG